MSDVAFNSSSSASRTYNFRLPVHVPCFGIGMVIAKLKRIGVWEELPPALRQKTRSAGSDWSGLRITQADLDSIPDDTWNVVASALRLE
jgi:hypothetical protein